MTLSVIQAALPASPRPAKVRPQHLQIHIDISGAMNSTPKRCAAAD
ncbi:MAG: hypothetical protein WCK17_16495 [Verrucomicrobiota bacterium]